MLTHYRVGGLEIDNFETDLPLKKVRSRMRRFIYYIHVDGSISIQIGLFVRVSVSFERESWSLFMQIGLFVRGGFSFETDFCLKTENKLSQRQIETDLPLGGFSFETDLPLGKRSF